MSPTLEKVLREIDELPEAEQINLYTRLRETFDPAAGPVSAVDAADAEVAWDAEVARRVKEVKDGKVEVVSGSEADNRTARLLSRLGVDPRARTA